VLAAWAALLRAEPAAHLVLVEFLFHAQAALPLPFSRRSPL
jgi:hypothetical protein